MINIYVLLSSLLFLFLGVIWGRSNWMNLTMKFVFCIMALLGLFMGGNNFGMW